MATYGYFDDAQREYVITNPHTPVKWINYVGSLDFGGFLDHTGGALLCYGDPALNRITRYLHTTPASEFRGTTLYLRLRRGRRQRIFSPYYVPTLDPFDRFECHVGLGYMRFLTEFYNICSDITVFVPPGEPCLLHDIRVANFGPRRCTLDAIPVVEYSHPDALKQFTNLDWVPQTMQSRAAPEPDGRLVLIQYPFMFRSIRLNYFTASLPASSFDTDRRAFLGQNEYGTWAHPLGLDQDELNNTQAERGDNIAALLIRLGSLAPGETRRLVTLLGQASDLPQAREVAARWCHPQGVEEGLRSLQEWWDAYLAACQVRTPDADFNRMLNLHNPRQCYVTKTWSRYLSLYQTGMGARSMGVRDTAQDVLGILAHAPAEAAPVLRTLLCMQRPDGSAMHQFNPLTLVGDEGDSREVEGALHYYSDDHLWIVLAVTAYLKETGDLAILEESIPYYDPGRRALPPTGPVLDHLQRALAFTRSDTGAHGLPRLGFADWNDTVNLRPAAESLFAAHLYGRVLQEMIELSEHLGRTADAESCRRDYLEMRQRVNDHAWDGSWYIDYFDADGSPLGSHRNAHGRLFLNGQTWAVLSGFALPERARSALDSVFTHLNTPRGIKLLTPPYDGYDPHKGGITTYPPGAKENGGIFLHTNPWAVIAEALLGNGDRAYLYYRQINPASANERIKEYECEPYVYAQNILADEHPHFGLARNSWLTGTAAWALQAGLYHILGVQPTYRGLRLQPCIPSQWEGFSVQRVFRGARYLIEVENPQHVCRGIRSMEVDGTSLEGDLLPIRGDGKDHRVHVVLGAP